MFDVKESNYSSFEDFVQAFANMYNHISSDEWELVLSECKEKGYDVSCVREYRKNDGDLFNIMNHKDLLDNLLYATGHLKDFVLPSLSDFGIFDEIKDMDVMKGKVSVGSFDILKFIEKYNKMTDDEWNAVIQKVKREGYDISNVMDYRKKYGSDFNIQLIDNIFRILLLMEGQDIQWM